MYAIEYRDVTKQFAGLQTPAVDHVSALIEDGELVTILGSSGCGKTTLLKMTNRLYDADGGQILVYGENIADTDAVALRRRMGYVIQQVGLFPHMTVEQNITAVPSLLKWPKEKRTEKTVELLKLVGLDPEQFLNRYPHQLSGGQQQRIGLARALVTDPKILLMDEPFGAIDAITRLHLQITLITLAFSIVIASVLTLPALRFRRIQNALGQFLGILYSIPSLALFALLIPVTGLGRTTAIIVLTIYNQYLLVRNFLTGMQEVDPAAVEAAKGIGMTRMQVVRLVQLPLAKSAILAGIRLAVVSTVGIATINAGGLGTLLFDGLRTMNMAKIMWGSLLSAGLAVALNACLSR